MPWLIRAHKDGYRRGGAAHSTEPTLHPDHAFNEEQLQQLRDDSRIMIQYVQPEVPEPAPSETPEDTAARAAAAASEPAAEGEAVQADATAGSGQTAHSEAAAGKKGPAAAKK